MYPVGTIPSSSAVGVDRELANSYLKETVQDRHSFGEVGQAPSTQVATLHRYNAFMDAKSGLRRFKPGAVILHRTPSVADSGQQPPTICDVRPMTVVEDSETLTSLWLPAGTPTKLAMPLVAGASPPWLAGEWRLVDAVWDRWNTLLFMVPGQWRATWIQWTPEWEFVGWYVNMEEPLQRTALGFDARDLWLDILVDPSRQWRWKDSDHLERAIRLGMASEAVAERARSEALPVIPDIEGDSWPFTPEVRDWRPDPAWPLPTLRGIAPDELVGIHDENHWTNPHRL